LVPAAPEGGRRVPRRPVVLAGGLLAALAPLGAAAPAGASPSPPPIKVLGRVTNRVTGRHLGGAEVRLEFYPVDPHQPTPPPIRTALANPGGHYKFEDVPSEWAIRVFASAAGYETAGSFDGPPVYYPQPPPIHPEVIHADFALAPLPPVVDR
jgi:hypothetical protein